MIFLYSKPMKATETLNYLGFFRTTRPGFWLSDNAEIVVTVSGETITYNYTDYTPEEFLHLMLS